MAFDSKKFFIRTGSAAVFVVVLLGCVFWNYISFSILFFVIALWGLQEFYKLMKINGNSPQKWVGYALTICGWFLSFDHNLVLAALNLDTSSVLFRILYTCPRVAVVMIPTLLFLYPVFELFRKKEKPFENISITLSGVFYVVLPFLLLNPIATVHLDLYMLPNATGLFQSAGHYKPQLIFALFLLIWSNDTFAYLVGSFMGKHKMIERISPGKTWEGTIGGALLTVGFSCFFYNLFGLLLPFHWIMISVIVVVFGTLGDLVESMLKRSVGVKDSGKIMPGHGGILDRFDSLILVAPFVFLYLLFK